VLIAGDNGDNTGGTRIQDFSDDFFTVLNGPSAGPTTIEIMYPRAGYVLENTGAKDSGRIALIQWQEYNGDYPLNIWLTNANGDIMKLIATNVLDTGSYSWSYDPNIPAGSYQIEIDVMYPPEASGQDRAYSGAFTVTK